MPAPDPGRRPLDRRRPDRLRRVAHAIQEVVADELELIDDERLGLATVTGVRIDPDLRHARVWFSSLDRGDEEIAAVLGEHRVRLQKAIARQLRLKRTPELAFVPDPAIAAGTRVEDILRGLHTGDDRDGSNGEWADG